MNALDHDQRTALHGATNENHYNICKVLLDNGALVNAKDSHSRTVLHDSVSLNLLELSILFVEHGADLAAEEIDDRYTPLHIAADKGFTEIAQMLILRGSSLMASGNKVIENFRHSSASSHLLAAFISFYF